MSKSPMSKSPRIYPTQDFSFLKFPKIANFLEPKTMTFEEIKLLATHNTLPKMKINGKNVAEKILNLFDSDNIRFGQKNNIVSTYEDKCQQINYFLNYQVPIEIYIMSLPFKIQCPLKTKRQKADMGELLFFMRLKNILDQIKEFYQFGAKITIFTEAALGQDLLDQATIQEFQDSVREMVILLGLKNEINFLEIGDMCQQLPDFTKILDYQKKLNLEDLKTKKDPLYSIFQDEIDYTSKIVPSNMYSETQLEMIYNSNILTKSDNSIIQTAKDEILERTEFALIQYSSLLKIIKDYKLRENKIPNGLAVTVVYQKEKISICSVNRATKILSFHGVTVFDQKNKTFKVEYLSKIKRQNKDFYPIYKQNDEDNEPFLYISQ